MSILDLNLEPPELPHRKLKLLRINKKRPEDSAILVKLHLDSQGITLLLHERIPADHFVDADRSQRDNQDQEEGAEPGVAAAADTALAPLSNEGLFPLVFLNFHAGLSFRRGGRHWVDLFLVDDGVF
jgi:hypothetical protein